MAKAMQSNACSITSLAVTLKDDIGTSDDCVFQIQRFIHGRYMLREDRLCRVCGNINHSSPRPFSFISTIYKTTTIKPPYFRFIIQIWFVNSNLAQFGSMCARSSLNLHALTHMQVPVSFFMHLIYHACSAHQCSTIRLVSKSGVLHFMSTG